MPADEEQRMLAYLIKIGIKPYKSEEFIKSIHSFSSKIRRQKGCLGYSVYQDTHEDNAYCLFGEWKTRQSMEKHFRTHEFEVVIGAARVLGETFVMNIADISETGGFELAKKQIASQKIENSVAD